MKTILKRIALKTSISPNVIHQYAIHHEDSEFLCRTGDNWFVSQLHIDETVENPNSPDGDIHVVMRGVAIPMEAVDEINLLLLR